MNEIFPRFIDYIKDTRSAQTLIAKCIEKNTPVIKLLRSNGFIHSNSEYTLFNSNTYSFDSYVLQID
jgi:RimJ/RimL family protein N-acetyltransferase